MQQHSEQLKSVLPSKCCFPPYEDHPLLSKSTLKPPPTRSKWGQSTPTSLPLLPSAFCSDSSGFLHSRPFLSELGSPQGSWKNTKMSWRNCWQSCYRTPQTVLSEAWFLPGEFCLSLFSPAHQHGDIYTPQKGFCVTFARFVEPSDPNSSRVHPSGKVIPS